MTGLTNLSLAGLASLLLPTITEAVTGTKCEPLKYSNYCIACGTTAGYDHICQEQFGWQYTAGEGEHGCGFLSMGCTITCKYNTDLGAPWLWDYGCGCDEGTECLNLPNLDIDCVMGDWGSWTSCSVAYAPDEPIKYGYMDRFRVVEVHPQNNGAQCAHTGEELQCDSHSQRVDCKVGGWTPWSECSKACGGGVETQTRPITQQPQNGGDACGTLQKQRACNVDACFWFTVTGKKGNEQVKIAEGNGEAIKYTLNEPFSMSTNSNDLTVEFLNDGKGKDVVFEFDDNPDGFITEGNIYFDRKWNSWKCDTNNENSRCDRVRDGDFAWNGEYEITFEDRPMLTGNRR